MAEERHRKRMVEEEYSGVESAEGGVARRAHNQEESFILIVNSLLVKLGL